jgi:hypothetical protein
MAQSTPASARPSKAAATSTPDRRDVDAPTIRGETADPCPPRSTVPRPAGRRAAQVTFCTSRSTCSSRPASRGDSATQRSQCRRRWSAIWRRCASQAVAPARQHQRARFPPPRPYPPRGDLSGSSFPLDALARGPMRRREISGGIEGASGRGMKRTNSKKLSLTRLTTKSLGAVAGGQPSISCEVNCSMYCDSIDECATMGRRCAPPITLATLCVTFCAAPSAPPVCALP